MEHERGRPETWEQPRLGNNELDVRDLIIAALIEQSGRRGAERDAFQIENAALRKRADYDHLTGLHKEDVWSEKMEAALKTGKTVVFIMLDLDNFKGVNDTYGHHEGDNVLVAVSKGLLEYFGRESDILTALRSETQVARKGGDEFCVGIVADADSTDAPGGHDRRTASVADIIDYAQRSITRIEANDYLRRMGIGLSMGVAVSDPAHYESVKELLRLADRGMYRCKEARRNGRPTVAVVVRPRSALEDSAEPAQLAASNDAA